MRIKNQIQNHVSFLLFLLVFVLMIPFLSFGKTLTISQEFDRGNAYFHQHNYPKAIYWWKKEAAAQGNAMIYFDLGNAYIHAKEIPQYALKAINWWEKAAAQGFALADNELATSEFCNKP